MDRINLTEDEALLIQIFLSILLIISLTLNVVYLFSIKSFNDRLNATEALQFSKTIIVLMTLILLLPLEVISTSVNGCIVKKICLLKDCMEKLLMEMYPLTVLVIAITRLRVCVCLGNANILVTKTSAFITLALSIVFSLGFALGSLVLKIKSDFAESYQVFLYDLITLMLVSILSIFASCVIYAFIFYRVKATASPLSLGRSRHFGNFQHQRHRTVSIVRQRQDTNVQLSILILMTVFISSWITYVALTVMYRIFDFEVAKFALSISKVVVCLLHPIAEGMFLAQKRNNLEYFVRRICNRTKFNKKIEPDLSSYVDSEIVRNASLSLALSTVQEVPVGLKTRKSTRRNMLSSIGKQISNDNLHTRRTGDILSSFEIPLNDEEACTETNEHNIERRVLTHICCGHCGICQEGINSSKTYYKCPTEVSTYGEKQCNKRISLTKVYQDHSSEVASLPELILTPHSSHDETFSRIIPTNRLQSFHAQRPFQSNEPQVRIRSFSNDSNAKNGRRRFDSSTCKPRIGTDGSLSRKSSTSSCSSFSKRTELNRSMRISPISSSNSCEQNIEMFPIGKLRNVSPVGGNQRSSLKSCLKSKTRKASKSSYKCPRCRVFTISPSYEMTNQKRSNGISIGSSITHRSEETIPNHNILFVSQYPSNSTCKCHKSTNSKQSFGSYASIHTPDSELSDSKGVRFKFSSIEVEESGHPNDEEQEVAFQSPRINLGVNDAGNKLSTLIKHF